MKHNSNISGQPDDSLRQKAGTGGNFPVPEGYFGSFNERLKNRLLEGGRSKPSNYRYIYITGGIAAAAAVLAVFFFLSRPAVNAPASNGSPTYSVHDFLAEPYITHLVYTTSERNLLNNSNDSLTYLNNRDSLSSNWANNKEKLDPDAVLDYLYYNNGNVYSIIDWQ